ncbi:MAG: hypothetical protein HYX32_04415 [Actinobacteria bacterium]|nr:hypothetical protein [Actinomycetota bacterium]
MTIHRDATTRSTDNQPRRPRRHISSRPIVLALAALALAFGVLAAASPAQAADPGAVTDWVQRINAARAANGVGPLQIDGQLQQLAQDRSDANGRTGMLAHTPSMSAGLTSNWQKLGENVGVGPSRDIIWTAFINSTPHRTNILDPSFTHIGIGETVVNGQIWITQRFMRLGPSSPAPAPVIVAPPPVVVPRTVSPAPAPAVTQAPAPRPTTTKPAPDAARPATTSTTPELPTTTVPPDDVGSVPAASPVPNAEAVVDALRVLQQ